MKRPLQLPLAIALALGGTNALALGLGPVHVNSKLNQPLDAEIPVLQGGPGEAEGLLVNLAAAEDFDRIGLNRSRLNVPLEFSLGKNSRGEPIIKVTSKEPVRDSFLDFLVEANWPKGRLLREYTILLDPPVTAPATARTTTTSPMPASPGTVTLSKRERPAERPAVAAAPAAPRASTPKPAAAPAATAKVADGQYGPVEAGQTLSEVAHSVGDGRNVNQMMLALWKSNPNAFYKDNINALKRGAILRIPSADEVKAIGSATEAASQVQSQVEDWRGGRASPTLVADAGSKPSASPAAPPKKASGATAGTTPPKSSSERLELVPPKAGKDSIAMADRPGGGGAGSAAATELKSELARAKEALTARDQETGELKSRVKELEDLKGKNDRLIGLKDSEIAELQQKLKQLQDGKPTGMASKTPATSPATAATAAAAGAAAAAGSAASGSTSPTTPADKISKQDIWGEAGTSKNPAATDAGKPEPVKPDAAKPATTASTTSTTPSTSTPSTSTSTSSTPLPLAPTTPTVASPPAGPATPASSTGTPSTSAAGSSTPPAGSSTTTTPPTPPATTPTPAKPVVATPAKPAVKPRPITQPEPWYSAPWVMPVALGGAALLLLLGFFGMRKRKVAPVDAGRGSIAGAFGDSPFGGPDDAAALSVHEAEENKLRELLQHDPHNVGLHLELLSLYYAERDVAKFEYAAADMHSYVTDPHQPEWLEAQAMGQELAPHNPLFSNATHGDEVDAAFADHPAVQHAHDDDDAFATPVYRTELPAPPHAADHLDSDLAFDLDDSHLGTPPAAPTHPAKHESFDFDLPPLDLDTPSHELPSHDGHDLHAHTPAAAPPAARLDDDYFPGEDAVGTKLDLAKAYMDMGDPEGARSMLEEVVAEGSDAQKAEAHRLMAEIR